MFVREPISVISECLEAKAKVMEHRENERVKEC